MTGGSKMACFGAGAFVSYLFCSGVFYEAKKMAMQSYASDMIHVKNKTDVLEARISSIVSSLSKPKSDPISNKSDVLEARISSLESSLPKPESDTISKSS